MKRKPYEEGDWFALPTDAEYVVARIARVGKRKGNLLGYFFEPLRCAIPVERDIADLAPTDAFLIRKFGDLGLAEDGWPIIRSSMKWTRSEWPIPAFGRLDEFRAGRAFGVRYGDEDINQDVGLRSISVEEALNMPKDGMSGHIFSQRIVSRYFREGPSTYDPSDRKRSHFWFRGLPDPGSL